MYVFPDPITFNYIFSTFDLDTSITKGVVLILGRITPFSVCTG